MTNPNPMRVEEYLRRETLGVEGLLYEYFIPYCFMEKISLPKLKSSDEKTDKEESEDMTLMTERENNLIRNALRRFVFVRTTPEGLQQLQSRPWNCGAHLRLHRYLDRQGHHVTVPDDMMQPFIQLLCQQRVRFTIGLPLDDVVKNDVVVIDKGFFRGREAYVVDVLHTSDGIRLTLGLEMFAGTQSLLLYDYTQKDVLPKNGTLDFIGERFLSSIDDGLLNVLSHRMGGEQSEQERMADMAVLNRINHYSYVIISDCHHSMRFHGQMLFCSYLRRDEEACATYRQVAEKDLESLSDQDSPIGAYLQLVLYVVTRRVPYRASSKAYIQQHCDCPAYIRRLFSMARRLRSRK